MPDIGNGLEQGRGVYIESSLNSEKNQPNQLLDIQNYRPGLLFSFFLFLRYIF
jgi:hypothetical protein